MRPKATKVVAVKDDGGQSKEMYISPLVGMMLFENPINGIATRQGNPTTPDAESRRRDLVQAKPYLYDSMVSFNRTELILEAESFLQAVNRHL